MTTRRQDKTTTRQDKTTTRQDKSKDEKTRQVDTRPKSTLFYVFEVYCLQYTSVLRHKSQKFKGRRLAKGTRSEKIKPDKIRQGITRHDTTRQDNNKRRQDNNKTRQDNRKVREDNNKRRLDNNKTRPQQDETGQDKGRYEPGCCVCLAEGWTAER